MLIGTGGAPPRVPAALPLIGDAAALREFAAVRHTAAALTDASPTAYEFLVRLGAASRRPPTGVPSCRQDSAGGPARVTRSFAVARHCGLTEDDVQA
ncbi:hypothetical protein STENM327S_00748 [Streptomyces tendae]